MQQPCWLRRLFYPWFPPPEITVHHVVKSWPFSLSEVRAGIKTFEVRLDDRGYEVGHVLRLEGWLQYPGRYDGKWELVKVLHMARDGERDYKPQMEIPKGWVIMSIHRLGFNEDNQKDYRMHTLEQPRHK